VIRVVGDEPVIVAALFEALEGELVLDGGNYDVAGFGLEGAVDGQEGTVGNVGGRPVHTGAVDAGQIGAVGVGQQNLVEVDLRAEVVLGGARKTSGDRGFALDNPNWVTGGLQNVDGTHSRK
jgi:hypothetical protein